MLMLNSRSQKKMWKVAENIGNKEGRLDVCVAAAGILGDAAASLDCDDDQFRSVSATSSISS